MIMQYMIKINSWCFSVFLLGVWVIFLGPLFGSILLFGRGCGREASLLSLLFGFPSRWTGISPPELLHRFLLGLLCLLFLWIEAVSISGPWRYLDLGLSGCKLRSFCRSSPGRARILPGRSISGTKNWVLQSGQKVQERCRLHIVGTREEELDLVFYRRSNLLLGRVEAEVWWLEIVQF